MEISLVKLCELEFKKDPKLKEFANADKLMPDDESKILNIDITLDEPKKKFKG